MRPSAATAALTFALAAPLARATQYSLVDNFVGTGFLSGFTHEAIADPTQGRVNYVNQATALAQNLTYASGNTLIMRADYKTVLSASGPGRNSIRIKSNKAYQHGVTIFDIRHMPQGCSTWPAAWTTVENGWPVGGEIDVIEGTNDKGPNAMTLHASPGCTMPSSGRTMTGSVATTDCNTADNGNAGCGVTAPTANSYGPTFNANGGGWYIMERTSTFIKIWFFPRNAGPPGAFQSATGTVDTSTLGTPTAFFPNTNCNIDGYFAAQNIIFDLTLCGQWAGAVFNSDGCSGNCVDYVNSNPSAFVNAYWDVAGVRVYQ